jgi:hypothetical protein
VVTEIIVNRFRPLLNNLVSPYQTAFVPGNRGVDNVIIAQELIHSLHKKKVGRANSCSSLTLRRPMIGWNGALFVKSSFSLTFP